MIVCRTEEEIKNMFDETESQGFEWRDPMPLFCYEFWDDEEEVPQVNDTCPNCGKMTDRHCNFTKVVDGSMWGLEHCTSCDAVWFNKEDVVR